MYVRRLSFARAMVGVDRWIEFTMNGALVNLLLFILKVFTCRVNKQIEICLFRDNNEICLRKVHANVGQNLPAVYNGKYKILIGKTFQLK